LPPLALEPLRLQAVLGRLLLAREQLLERHEAARVQLRVTSRMLLGERRAGILRREHRRSLRNLGPECRDRALERRALRALELAHAGALGFEAAKASLELCRNRLAGRDEPAAQP